MSTQTPSAVIILPIQTQTLFPLEGLGHQTLVTHAILTPNNKNQKITHNEISNPKDVVCSRAWGPMLVF